MRIDNRGKGPVHIPKILEKSKNHTSEVAQNLMTIVFKGKPIPNPSSELPSNRTPQKVNRFAPPRILGRS